MKVLIIEDHPMVVQGWVMQIKHHAPDCQIHHVNDWPSAHTIVMRSHRLQVPFDWVIMDVALSRSQSQDALLPPLAQRIRACAPSLVWVCTALNDDSIRQTCAQQGARWVAKTMHSVTWQRMVREQLLAAITTAVGGVYRLPTPEDERDLPLTFVQEGTDDATADYDYHYLVMPVAVATGAHAISPDRAAQRAQAHAMLAELVAHDDWLPTDYTQGHIQERLKDICLTLDPADWFDLEKPIINRVNVKLPTKARAKLNVSTSKASS